MINLQTGRTYDLLPPNFKNDPEVAAFCYAIDRSQTKVFERALKTQIWSRLREMPEDVIDYLAAELRTPFYDKAKNLDIKRDMVASTFEWYARLGTRETLVDIVNKAYGDVSVTEWFEYGGNPYTFRVKLFQILDGWVEVEDFVKLLIWVKNTRSWLDRLTMARSWEKRMWYFVHSAGYARVNLKPEYLKSYAAPLCRGLISAVRERYVAV